MLLRILFSLFLVLFFALANVLFAQDFSAQNSKYSPSIYGDKFTYEEDKFYYFNELSGVLFLKGKIEKGMYKDFRQAITDNNIQTLVLDSPGGSVSEGLRIAGTVFDRKIKTYIRKNQNCASACSFIFLSGKTRYTLGKLGVHQIAFGEEFSKKKEEIGLIGEVVQLTNSDIVQYLDENNTPGFVYKYMLRTPSDEMYYFKEDELNQLGNSDISSEDKLHFNRIDNFTKDYNSHIIKQKCDNDPNSCTTTQLCARATRNKAWRTSLDAYKFVKLAKSKGKRCGVPDPICPENIKKCNKEYLCTYGTTGMDASLSWLNNSFADEAKLRNYTCGIISKPILYISPKPFSKFGFWEKKCLKNLNKCSNETICHFATYWNGSNKLWKTDPDYKVFIDEAQRGLIDCYVKTKLIVKKTCSQDAESCNDTALCLKATTTINGQKTWDKRLVRASYISKAKKRKLSCGVRVAKKIINNKPKITIVSFCQSNIGFNCADENGVITYHTYQLAVAQENDTIATIAARIGISAENLAKKNGLKTYSNIKNGEALNIPAVKLYSNCAMKPNLVFKNKAIYCENNDDVRKILPREKFVEKNDAEMIISIQKQLNLLGCNAGYADGIVGNKTLLALKRWKTAGGDYTPNFLDHQLRKRLFKTQKKCSVTTLSKSSSSINLTLAGTWNVVYSLCSSQRYKATLKLSKLKQKEYYATYDAVHGYYTGKANLHNGSFKMFLSGVNGKLTASGFINKYFNRAQGKDQNGCLFEGNKR